MPFPSEQSAGALVKLRQDVQHSTQYLLLCPNSVVWQTQPASAVDGAIPYAEFEWDGTDQGDRADVQVGMTVIISTSTDYQNTEVFRGRIRAVPDDDNVYINETSLNLETTDYVTVIDDFDIHERLERRTTENDEFKDWDIVFTRLPPTISGLQSSYVDTSANANVSIAFAPTVTAQAQGATISSYSWDVADGTITAGSSTTKDITVQFPGAATNEHRWVRFTATDSYGTSQYFVFEVYTVNLADTSPTTIKLNTGDVTITCNRETGYNANIRAWDGFSSVLDRTRATIVSEDDYNGVRALDFTSGGTTEIVAGNTITGATSSATAAVVAVDLDSGTWAGGDAAGTLWVNEVSGTFQSENLNVGATTNVATIAGDVENPYFTQNVMFVGRIRTDINDTRGDEVYAKVKSVSLTIEGFRTQLGRIIGPGLYLNEAPSDSGVPVEWGEIGTLTIGRAIVYMLAWHTTFLNVSSFTLPSDINDYVWPEFVIPPGPVTQWVESVSHAINGWLIFAASGECTLMRHASYAGTDGLDTIMQIVTDEGATSDVLELTLSVDHSDTKARALVAGATYDTTLNDEKVFKGLAPAQVYGPGWEIATLDGQILKSDLTDAEANTEIGTRAVRHLQFENPKPTLNVRLPSGYYWLVPSDHQLYSFDIDVDDVVTGRQFTADNKWLLTAIDITFNAAGWYDVRATFELVTGVNVGNYGITVTEIIDVNDLAPTDLPGTPAGNEPFDPCANQGPDCEDDIPGGGPHPTDPGDPPPTPESGCETLKVNMAGIGAFTTNNTVNGETYIVQVEGSGTLGIDSPWTHRFEAEDIINPDTGWFILTGQYNSAGYIETSASTPPYDVAARHVPPNGRLITITQVVVRYRNGSDTANTEQVITKALPFVTLADSGGNLGVPQDRTLTWTGTNTYDTHLTAYGNWVGPTGRIYWVQVTGTGWNPWSQPVRGDAFYKGYNTPSGPELYPSGEGLLVNGVLPAGVGAYKNNHVYVFTVTGDGSPMSFSFVDSDYTDNSGSLDITVCGPNMSSTPE